jgi:phenylpyruvate tautomerase PptA (4-oxalocrotonate tautomerase family)
MPFIIARVNVPVSKEQETKIKTRMGQAIELVPGKNESYLMLGIEDNYRFYLHGDGTQKAAYIEASIFGNEDHSGFDGFAAVTTEIFQQILGIPPENIYIKFDDIKALSAGGAFIDRNRYR